MRAAGVSPALSSWHTLSAARKLLTQHGLQPGERQTHIRKMGVDYISVWRAARQFGKLGSAMFAHQDPSVLILTAIHNKPCVYQKGDHLNFMSILNKQARACRSACSAIMRCPPHVWQPALDAHLHHAFMQQS